MQEGTPGTSRSSRSGVMPEDTVNAQKIGSWQLYLSKSEQALIIDTTDYHPGLLFLSKADLKCLLRRLDDFSHS